MKKLAYIFITSISILLASCTKETTLEEINENHNIKISLSSQNQYIGETLPQTKGETVSLDRYIMEVYSDVNCTQPVNLFGGSNRKEQNTPDFELTLDGSKSYTCLFWADYQSSTVYDVSSLKAVTLKSNQVNTEAYFAKTTISARNQTNNIVLNRAVAKIVLKDAVGVFENDHFVVKYSVPTTFNVLTGTASTVTEINRDITFNSTTTANQEFNSFYVFANSTQSTFNLFFNYDGQAAKKISNVPYMANKRSSLTGNYVDIFNIGDKYPKTGTTIGIVYDINNHGTHGLITALDERANQRYDWAEAWANSYNKGGKIWRIPTIEELEYLYCVYKKIPKQTWLDIQGLTYPSINTPASNPIELNNILSSLSALGGTGLGLGDGFSSSTDYHSSSIGYDTDFPLNRPSIDFIQGAFMAEQDGLVMNVRLITSF